MFDPKSILDALVRGNAQQSPGASSGGGLDELLRKYLPDAGARRGASPQSADLQPGEGAPSGSGNPLGDLLSQLQQQGGGGLSDMLGKLQAQASQPAASPTSSARCSGRRKPVCAKAPAASTRPPARPTACARLRAR